MQPSKSSDSSKKNLQKILSSAGTSDIGQESEGKNTDLPEATKNPPLSTSSNSTTQQNNAKTPVISTSKPSNVALSTSNNDNPAVADDNDLIEKEWVAKAKQIIEDNREDPHRQSNEITTFKSDYMRKRYNKVVNPSE